MTLRDLIEQALALPPEALDMEVERPDGYEPAISGELRADVEGIRVENGVVVVE